MLYIIIGVKGLALLNTPNKPINNYSNIINLAYLNISLAYIIIKKHLAITANYYILSISLETSLKRALNPARYKVSNKEKFVEIVAIGAKHL